MAEGLAINIITVICSSHVHQAVHMSYISQLVTPEQGDDGRNERSEYFPKWADIDFEHLVI